MLEVEVIGRQRTIPPDAEIERLAALAAASAGFEEGHVAIQFVDAGRMAVLNAEHRGKDGPTDVLSFPVDGEGLVTTSGPDVELGDVVICAEHTADVREAIVHGVLHLTGMDHEVDNGEMLALQAEILSW